MKKAHPIGYGLKGKIYLSLLRNLVCLPIFFLWGRGISGRHNIPFQGPILVVANHQSFLDFLFVTLALRKYKYISYLIKAKYYDLPIFRFFLNDMAQVRADKHCIKKAFEVLQYGCPLILFPEGTRTRTGKIGKCYPGIEVLAGQFPNMPVLPMGISGAFEIWPWNRKTPRWFGGRKIMLKIGKPLFFADFVNKEESFAREVMKNVDRFVGQ